MTGGRLEDAFTDERLRAGARAALRALDGAVTAVEPIPLGNRKRTAVARFEMRGPVVVQVCTESTWLRTEATLLSLIRDRTGVPVPPVLGAGEHDGVAYLLTAYVAGDDLHERFTAVDPDVRTLLARSFGSYLAQLHDAFAFDGYGRLETPGAFSPPGDVLSPAHEDWADWFREYGLRAVDRLPAAFDPLRSELRGLFDDRPIEGRPQARLYPWDFRPGNALVADDRVTAVLDWEAPLAAPVSLSVAKAEFLVADWYVNEPAPLRAAFRTGYERVRPYPDVPTAHRVAAIAESAVDSAGRVTNPRYPELDREGAVAFHRDALEAALAGTDDRDR
ncbi:phosphotransferase family protein [Haloarchaeobius iranensis]|uniref:Phosphotransferase enzyme family protein n=1 Tax=Haloarchaeobius iranensis TaxID=996166 RepID=A0A1H0AVB5_9EURY|nr:phosphotransferase [Haloarchaeobius iranensis]SDN37392.1 Phosphotransferase enzyme family protein [Haloarchaeobius iranensis]